MDDVADANMLDPMDVPAGGKGTPPNPSMAHIIANATSNYLSTVQLDTHAQGLPGIDQEMTNYRNSSPRPSDHNQDHSTNDKVFSDAPDIESNDDASASTADTNADADMIAHTDGDDNPDAENTDSNTKGDNTDKSNNTVSKRGEDSLRYSTNSEWNSSPWSIVSYRKSHSQSFTGSPRTNNGNCNNGTDKHKPNHNNPADKQSHGTYNTSNTDPYEMGTDAAQNITANTITLNHNDNNPSS
jgi:hypothetical protein